LKNIITYITKDSKRIVIYILTVLISGSILTFLSINNISNFKELTEKRITEDEKAIVENYRIQFQNTLENLVISLEKNTQNDTLNHNIEAFVLENKLVDDYLIMNKNGVLIRPHFLEKSFKINRKSSHIFYAQKYQQAERFEFTQLDYKPAEKQYLSSLKFANSQSDSAKVYNAVARLNIKIGNQKKALEFYRGIITDLNSTLNDFGFPYAYFSLNQLLKLSDSTLRTDMEEVLMIFLRGLLDNTIPYNQSSSELIETVLKWSDQINNKETKQIVQTLCQNINIKILEILNYREGMSAIVKNEKEELSTRLNDFLVVENENDHNQIMLLKKSDENIVGYIVKLKNLDSLILENINHTPGKFEYHIQLVDASLNNSVYNKKLIIQSNFSPFFNKKWIEVKLKSPSKVEDFVLKRKLTTAIGLFLLLAAMLIGLFTLIRDVSRKKRMDRMRADFVSNVTHELKTPLTSINMFADSIVLNRVTKEKEIKKYAHVIVKESERLKRMVNNILDFSRKESDKLKYHLKDSNLAEIVNEIMLEMNYWLEIHNFEVQLDIEENVYATVDPEALKQVLSNLITNAIKYSSTEKKIEIRLYKKLEKAYLEVEDHGIGIPEDKQNHIFEKFYRVNSKKNENISGTGLGLTVSKDIIEAQNGKLLVSSTLNKGSKFTIVLTI